MRKIQAALFVGLVACGFRVGDIAAESTFVALTVADWGQTNGIVQHCGETNPVIGNCGQHISPGLYFPIAIGLHILADYLMPEEWRGIFEGISIGFEIKSVAHNFGMNDPIIF